MIKLFTHTDLDGAGCAILARLSNFSDRLDIEYCDYADVDSKIKKFIMAQMKTDDVVIITDVIIDKSLMDVIDEYGSQFYMLTHHDEEFALNSKKYSWCNVVPYDKQTGDKTCSTKLFHDLLVRNNYLESNKQLKNLVKIISNFDTWNWCTMGEKGLISKKLNDLFDIYGSEKFVNNIVEKINDNVFPDFTDDELFLLDVMEKQATESAIGIEDCVNIINVIGNHVKKEYGNEK